MSKSGRPKAKILRWKGVMADGGRTMRGAVAAVLAITCATLTFTQLGFAGVGSAGSYDYYIVVLLMPVALGALLLGTLWGAGIGLVAGAVLLAHSTVMPLDYYELTFVTPLTSVVMFTAIGLLLGILFAFVLRNDRRGVRRVAYIAIVCFVMSSLYTAGFAVNAVFALVVELIEANADLVAEFGVEAIQERAARAALGMGSIDLQMLSDAVLMAVLCCLGDLVARRAVEKAPNAGLRSTFGAWLSTVVLVAFMTSATLSFVSITDSTKVSATDDMHSEADYLLNQLAASDSRMSSMLEVFQELGIGDEQLEGDEMMANLLGSFAISGLLDGYSEDSDGIVLITLNDYITLSDCDWIANSHKNDQSGEALSEEELENIDFDAFLLGRYFDDNVIAAIDRSKESGELQRVVYEAGGKQAISLDDVTDAPSHMRIGYLTSDSRDLYTVTIIRPSEMVFAERDNTMAWVTMSSFVLLLAVFALTWRLLSVLVARRIDETNGTLARITGGELDVRVAPKGTREFKSLSAGINTTVDALQGWIAEAESRMDAELAAAKAIQESALPRTFPPFPGITRFDIFASMNAAREVGGDFYDFFLVGDECGPEQGKVGFVMADVSGKGVPAALFMMKASAEVRDRIGSGMALGEAVAAANGKLCEGNDAGMFVTMWAGVLDYATGHVEYVNAGHNPPLLRQDGEWRWLEDRSGLPLGLFDGMPYEAFSIDCAPGDMFLLYTDGVTEAMSVTGELYGEERLENLLKADGADGGTGTLHPHDLVDAVRADVAAHAADAEQSDDITILALEVGC